MDIDDVNGLSEKERKEKRDAWVQGVLGIIVGFLIAICIALVIISLGSCKSVQEQSEKVVYVNRTDTVRQKVVEKDSVWVDRWREGDTVYVIKTAERVRWRDRWHTDTCYVSKTDTIFGIKTVVKTVTKRGKEWAFILLAALLIVAAAFVAKFKRN